MLLEESIIGWKEYELELMRDRNDNVVVVCSIENVDPMGVHTGDSITVAPALTLTDREYQRMRDVGIAVIRAVGVDTGGCNIQFAVDPATAGMIVIEMNPRVSRSSALASKATGFPIAKIAAKLAVGYTLDEIPNDITRETPASFEPTLDYVVVKVPRFAFEKFPQADPTLTTTMKSVGEAMAIGRNFTEALQKALRSLERPDVGLRLARRRGRLDKAALVAQAALPRDGRLDVVQQALRAGATRRRGARGDRHRPVVPRPDRADQRGRRRGRGRAPSSTPTLLRRAKRHGFSDRQLGELRGADRGRWCAGCGTRSASARSTRPSTPARRSSRRARRTTTPPTTRRPRSRRASEPAVLILGSGPEPHRPGHRVRLLLRARGDDAARGRATRRSWSTATRRPSPPTTTPATGSTSSR